MNSEAEILLQMTTNLEVESLLGRAANNRAGRELGKVFIDRIPVVV